MTTACSCTMEHRIPFMIDNIGAHSKVKQIFEHFAVAFKCSFMKSILFE